MGRRGATLPVVLLLACVAGCGTDTQLSGPPATSPPPETLTVFAASSLTTTFTRLGTTFEREHPGTTVRFSFAGSSELVSQLRGGATADVLATADEATMAQADADHLVLGTPVTFASNTLEIVVPPGNPGKVSSLADLTRAGVSVVVCAPAVPCGAAARRVETAAGVTLRPVSEEPSVTEVLSKVESGEADAGLVYVTDVRSAGAKVLGVRLPQATKAVNRYPVAALAGSAHQDLAEEFEALVTGAEGQQVLAAAGFAPA